MMKYVIVLGAILLIMFGTFLPALIAWRSRAIGSSILAACLGLLSLPLLLFGIIPGVICWFMALTVGVCGANHANQQRLHRDMMAAMGPPRQEVPVPLPALACPGDASRS